MNASEFMMRAQCRVYQNMPSFATMLTTAADSASQPGAVACSYAPVAIDWIEANPMPAPVAANIRPSAMDARHSKRSWPYGWLSSASRCEILTPRNAMEVANTSDSECTASETMAAELPNMPANNLNADSATLPLTPTMASLFAMRFSSSSEPAVLPAAALFARFFVSMMSTLPHRLPHGLPARRAARRF